MFELDIRIRKQLRGTAHDLRGEKSVDRFDSA